VATDWLLAVLFCIYACCTVSAAVIGLCDWLSVLYIAVVRALTVSAALK